MDDLSQGDICRVCRCEAQSDRPLFYPCICTGSIKYIHQDCLTLWMRYSQKEYCELCGHRFSFTPIYAPDMPRVLPMRDVAGGLFSSVGKAVKYWLHYTLVAFAWFGMVPLSAYRTYRFMFNGSSLDMILTQPFDVFSTENIPADAFRGCFVVSGTLLSFIGMVWLREQLMHGGGPDWLDRDEVAPIARGGGNRDGNAVHDNGPQIVAEAAAAPEPQVGEAIVDGPIELNDNNNNENNNNENEAPVDEPINNAEPPPAIAEVLERNLELNEEPADMGNGGEWANWNPIEWDRAAEELTWERLLGLDGSMVFLEHVLWVISLNVVFIFIFGFCPYCIGDFVLKWMEKLRNNKPLLNLHGLVLTFFGYWIIGLTLLVLHYFADLFKMSKIRWLFGACYIVVKVTLLFAVEIGVLPLVCGWWLDICSLPMFNATIKDRQSSFRITPCNSLFTHWMFGMVYYYYFNAFTSLLREVLRPGVLWFLRNFNDPDFSPIQEMIHDSVVQHVRRLIVSVTIFGSAILLKLWLPVRVLKSQWPTLLPYTLSADTQINELSLQLLAFAIILPGFFEQSHTRVWLKGLLRIWCQAVSCVLGIKSYLLGNDTTENRNRDQEEFERVHPPAFKPYNKPTFFPFRLFGIIVFISITLLILSLIILTIPVWIGRQVMALWFTGSLDKHENSTNSKVPSRPHELYAAAVGIYICWLIYRGISMAFNLFPQGRAAVMKKIKHWLHIGASYALAAIIFVLMLGVIPLLFGLLLELVLVIPLRVPLSQTPINFLWQDWALGVLYTKIYCALTLMGPDCRMKRAIERVYHDGVRDIDFKFIIRELATPVITCFGLALAVPYVIAYSIVPVIYKNVNTRALIARKVYPYCLMAVGAIVVVYFHTRQFKKFYIAIKNDKYLVGQRLVNYEHRRRKQEAADAAAAAAANANNEEGSAEVQAP